VELGSFPAGGGELIGLVLLIGGVVCAVVILIALVRMLIALVRLLIKFWALCKHSWEMLRPHQKTVPLPPLPPKIDEQTGSD
jgi:hypothetical protein